jgi:hypothetical protein
LRLAACLLPFACTTTQAGHDQQTDLPTLTALSWTLDWDTDGIDLASDGSWSTSSDLDYTVTISHAFIVTAAISLVPCTLESDTGIFAWMSLFLGQPAFANHAPFDDGSLHELSAKEWLTPSKSVSITSTSFPLTQYCSAYWLLARGGPESEVEHTSIELRGTWRHGDDAGSFDITSDFARASIADLSPIPVGTRQGHVTLTRPMARLFDGIDFAEANDYAIAWSVVHTMTDQATFVLN